MSTTATATPAAASSGANRALLAKLGRFQKPDLECNPLTWGPLTTVNTPTSLKTDKFISALILRWHGRITVSNATFTAVPDALRYLIQQVRVYGTHVQFGAQRVVAAQAQFLNQVNKAMRVSYLPGDQLSGAALGTWLTGGTIAIGSYDLDVLWTIPLFCMPFRTLKAVPLYSLKGPDWAGNLFLSFDTGDFSALGETVTANLAFSAYGGSGGSPVVYVHSIHPLMGVNVMNEISPAICFRTETIYDSIVQGSSFTQQVAAYLNIGKRYASLETQTGVLQTGTSAGVRCYASLSNTILTEYTISLDGKNLVQPAAQWDSNEWNGWLQEAPNPLGLSIYDFIQESENPDCAFPAETLTSARRFALVGNVAAASNQGLEVLQEEILGAPVITTAAASAASASS